MTIVGAEMDHGKVAASHGWSWVRGGTIASAILVTANIAHAQSTNPQGPTVSTGAPPASVQRLADPGHGPGGFADLAEKVQPAVIGVSIKAAALRKILPQLRKMLPDQSPEFGTPPDQDTPDNPVPTPRSPNQPGSLDEGEAQKIPETITIGSGFFISADGYAVTNNHVVEDSDTAEIRTSDDKTYPAKVVGKDSVSDLALIKVDGRTDFTYVKLSDQPARVGDWVLSAGNSFGLGNSVTAGIVSARDRKLENDSSEDFVQIDAPINSGDSGGPSFNTNGEVIGVNSMIYSPSGGSVGVAFAIPAATVKAVIPQLKDKGAVTRGWIGAEIQSITPDLAEGLGMNHVGGAIVANVQDNGPAAKAGLRSGDVITSVSGEPIKNAGELTKKIQASAPGSSIQLAMLRKGKQSSLGVTLGEFPNRARVRAPIAK
jgi:serine protease Do